MLRSPFTYVSSSYPKGPRSNRMPSLQLQTILDAVPDGFDLADVRLSLSTMDSRAYLVQFAYHKREDYEKLVRRPIECAPSWLAFCLDLQFLSGFDPRCWISNTTLETIGLCLPADIDPRLVLISRQDYLTVQYPILYQTFTVPEAAIVAPKEATCNEH